MGVRLVTTNIERGLHFLKKAARKEDSFLPVAYPTQLFLLLPASPWCGGWAHLGGERCDLSSISQRHEQADAHASWEEWGSKRSTLPTCLPPVPCCCAGTFLEDENRLHLNHKHACV